MFTMTTTTDNHFHSYVKTLPIPATLIRFHSYIVKVDIFAILYRLHKISRHDYVIWKPLYIIMSTQISVVRKFPYHDYWFSRCLTFASLHQRTIFCGDLISRFICVGRLYIQWRKLFAAIQFMDFNHPGNLRKLIKCKIPWFTVIQMMKHENVHMRKYPLIKYYNLSHSCNLFP